MPKRRHQDLDLHEYLDKKFKEMESKLMKKVKRRRYISSSSSSSSSSTRSSPPQTPTLQLGTQDCYPLQDESIHHSEYMGPEHELEPQPEQNKECLMDCDHATELVPSGEPIASTSTNTTQPNEADVELDENVLEILGADPSKPATDTKKIQKDLAVRLEYGVVKGLTKTDRKDLLDKYLVPENCKSVGAPSLNLELKGALTDFMLKRDRTIESHQKVTASAISSLGQAITTLLSEKDKNPDLLSNLMDTARLLCDRQHTDTATRRSFVINAVKKEMRDSLENAPVDNFLFAQNLSDTLKTAKAVNKTSSELVVKPTLKPTPSSSNKTTPKNWKTPHATRKPHATRATTTKTFVPTKGQQPNSYKQSANQRAPRYRR